MGGKVVRDVDRCSDLTYMCLSRPRHLAEVLEVTGRRNREPHSLSCDRPVDD